MITFPGLYSDLRPHFKCDMQLIEFITMPYPLQFNDEN